ncbi:MAG TPA: hypothetical protein VFR41_06055 [Acidimicrobiia bacterium]|nr:hypothetical protein [Acidimicrobiia bacterium]
MALTRPQHPARVAIVAAIIIIAVNFAILGGRSQRNGPAQTQRPVVIQALTPQEGELQVPQAPVGANLRDDYAGQLTIDGHHIPDDQITGDPTLSEVIFAPGPGKDFTELAKGAHTAVIEFWPKTVRDADAARRKKLLGSYTWTFNVG